MENLPLKPQKLAKSFRSDMGAGGNSAKTLPRAGIQFFMASRAFSALSWRSDVASLVSFIMALSCESFGCVIASQSCGGAMLTEKQLKSSLIAAFQLLAEQRRALSYALSEVAAVRDALIEIGPAYSEILDRHRACHRKEQDPLLGEDLLRYQEIIRQLKAG
jgi:hypothetical protein